MKGEKSHGMTLTEMVMAVLIFLLVGLGMVRTFTQGTRGVVKMEATLSGIENVNHALLLVARDIEEMTYISSATPTFLEFQLGGDRLPNYDPTADPDGDSAPNNIDPDDDNDRSMVSTLFSGLDVVDQDDDGDSKIDVQIRIWVDSLNRLVKEVNINEAGWASPIVLMTHIASDPFTYFGSLNHSVGAQADQAATGNNDNIVSQNEIDGFNNNNGSLDLQIERDLIAIIQIQLVRDANKDGKVDFEATTRFSPPLLLSNGEH